MAIKAVFGGASLNAAYHPTDDSVKELFSVLKQEGVDTIDTARLYPGSEETIGRTTTDFVIDTKIKGGFEAGTASRANIIKDVEDSLRQANVKQFDILYIHAPDTTVPIEETLEAVNEFYKKGAFKRFGLSNFLPEQVQEAYDVAKSKGYVLPSVYQGNYNAVARKTETLLFPLLRKLGFAFYAYSPIAGGFLTKTTEQLDEGAGRFNEKAIGGLYLKLYNKPSLREALSEWNSIAEKESVSKAELAYRWVGYHSLLDESKGDAVIFGSRTKEQARETAQWLKKGKLSDEAAKRIDAIWSKVEHEASLDNWTIS